MGKVSYTKCDGVDAEAVQCGSVTQSVQGWIVVAVHGERFDYCSVDCFRSFMVPLKRIFPGTV